MTARSPRRTRPNNRPEENIESIRLSFPQQNLVSSSSRDIPITQHSRHHHPSPPDETMDVQNLSAV